MGSRTLLNHLSRIVMEFGKCPVLFLPVLLFAACSSQPVMAPDKVAELHSGKLIINIPDNAFRIKSQAPIGEVLAEMILIATITVPEFGVGMAPVNDMYYASPGNSPALKPYSHELSRVPLSQDFRVLGREVVDAVPWMKRSSVPDIKHESNGISAGAMRHIVQSDNVNAIVFMQPVIIFTSDMSALAMRVTVSVYAKGERGPVFFDARTLTASTSLEKSGEPLTPDEMDDVDEGRGFINKTRAFRAKLWFAHRGERFNIALAEDLRLIKQRLVRYLHGHPHA